MLERIWDVVELPEDVVDVAAMEMSRSVGTRGGCVDRRIGD